MTDVSRRQAILLTAGGAAAVAAPAIIGRANPASAKNAFSGESLLVVSWSGNYERGFRESVVEPFNARYGTKVETIGGWDQMIPQIIAAPEDNPPFDITIGEEYVASAGIAQKLFLQKDWSAYPNMSAVYPWFISNRPERAKNIGVPFAGGTTLVLLRRSLGLDPTSWNTLWNERLKGKVTCDSAYWWFSLSIPTILRSKAPNLEEMYDINTAEPDFQKLEQLQIARWFKDGAEEANILNQGEADAATCYSSEVLAFLKQDPDEYIIGVPREGVAAWTDWFFKVRGTRHSDLADLFLDYLISNEAQNEFLAQSLAFMSRRDLTIPAHWQNYPQSNDDFDKMFRLLTMDGWDKINANYDAFDGRFKKVIMKTAGK